MVQGWFYAPLAINSQPFAYFLAGDFKLDV